MAGLDTHPPARQPPDHLLVGNVEQEHGGDPPTELRQLLIERLGLLDRAREPVEDEAVPGVLLLKPLGDHRDDQLVGNQVTRVMYSLGLAAELGPLA